MTPQQITAEINRFFLDNNNSYHNKLGSLWNIFHGSHSSWNMINLCCALDKMVEGWSYHQEEINNIPVLYQHTQELALYFYARGCQILLSAEFIGFRALSTFIDHISTLGFSLDTPITIGPQHVTNFGCLLENCVDRLIDLFEREDLTKEQHEECQTETLLRIMRGLYGCQLFYIKQLSGSSENPNCNNGRLNALVEHLHKKWQKNNNAGTDVNQFIQRIFNHWQHTGLLSKQNNNPAEINNTQPPKEKPVTYASIVGTKDNTKPRTVPKPKILQASKINRENSPKKNKQSTKKNQENKTLKTAEKPAQKVQSAQDDNDWSENLYVPTPPEYIICRTNINYGLHRFPYRDTQEQETKAEKKLRRVNKKSASTKKLTKKDLVRRIKEKRTIQVSNRDIEEKPSSWVNKLTRVASKVSDYFKSQPTNKIRTLINSRHKGEPALKLPAYKPKQPKQPSQYEQTVYQMGHCVLWLAKSPWHAVCFGYRHMPATRSKLMNWSLTSGAIMSSITAIHDYYYHPFGTLNVEDPNDFWQDLGPRLSSVFWAFGFAAGAYAFLHIGYEDAIQMQNKRKNGKSNNKM